MGGDSGAWIIDNASGSVCGHVLAWSSKSSLAYLSPMELLLADMARVLRAEVALPTFQTVVRKASPEAECAAAEEEEESSSPTASAASAESLSWLARNYTEEVVGEALGRSVVGNRAVGKQMVGGSSLLPSLRREVQVCGARNASASVTA